uniref:VHS domain-containing protein n=1 Tax=Glycine max TaxID=3847 RepID=A0A0R0HLJ5_SOYBN
MSENLMGKVNALGERLKIGGVEVGRKMSAGMSSRHADKLVGEATSEALHEPEWAGILHICDFINADQLNTAELVRVIKKRVVAKSPPRVQYLAFVLLESLIIKLIDDPQTIVNNRNKALMMIQAWGESTIELRYLPVYAETYKSLKSRGIGFPSRDNESLAPVFTPRSATASADHDDIHVQSFTSEQIKETFDVARNSIELLSSPYDMLDDLDEMIFGKKDRDDDAFDGGQHPKNPQSSSKDDLNSF